MSFSMSDLGPLLIGVGPVVICLVALVFIARFIRRSSEKKARRRFRRHGYTGYVSYNPTADPTYLNPPVIDASALDPTALPGETQHHHGSSPATGSDGSSHH